MKSRGIFITFCIRNRYYCGVFIKIYFQVLQIQVRCFYYVVNGVIFAFHYTILLSSAENKMKFQNNRLLTYESCFGFHRLSNAEERRWYAQHPFLPYRLISWLRFVLIFSSKFVLSYSISSLSTQKTMESKTPFLC